MKNIYFTYRSTLTLVALIFGGISFLFSQQPGIPYQAYFMDTNAGYVYGEKLENVPLANSKVLLRFDVHDDQNVLEYSERIELPTDKFGLGSTVIRGDGTAVFKSFKDIDWDGNSKTLHIYIDFTNSGNNFEKHGEMQIVYIPGPAEDVILGFYSGSGPPTAANPANPVDGSIYVDKTSGEQYAYNSAASTWKSQTDVLSTDAGNILTKDSSGLVYLDAATVVAAEADASPTNELNTAFGVNGVNLEITDAGGTLSVPLAAIDTDTDNQNLTAVTLGNLSVRMNTTAPRSLQLNPSVAMTLSGTGHNIVANLHTTSVDSRASVNFAANTWTKWSDATFGHHGSTQELVFLDELSNTLYRVTLIVEVVITIT